MNWMVSLISRVSSAHNFITNFVFCDLWTEWMYSGEAMPVCPPTCFTSKPNILILMKFCIRGLYYKLGNNSFITWTSNQSIQFSQTWLNVQKLGKWHKIQIYRFYFKYFPVWWIFNRTQGKVTSDCALISVEGLALQYQNIRINKVCKVTRNTSLSSSSSPSSLFSVHY
jgi:hypothetical protein